MVRFVSFFEGEACADRLSLVQVLGQRWSLAKAVGQSKNSLFLGFGEHVISLLKSQVVATTPFTAEHPQHQKTAGLSWAGAWPGWEFAEYGSGKTKHILGRAEHTVVDRTRHDLGISLLDSDILA